MNEDQAIGQLYETLEAVMEVPAAELKDTFTSILQNQNESQTLENHFTAVRNYVRWSKDRNSIDEYAIAQA
jgi:hypothetical protein